MFSNNLTTLLCKCSDWPIGIKAKDDREGKIKAAIQIEEAVEKLEKEEGIPPSRVVVGGFSQGGAVALLAAYHRRVEGKTPFAGCLCLSGWLTLKDELKVTDEVKSKTPLFWGHGQWDDKVLFELVYFSSSLLTFLAFFSFLVAATDAFFFNLSSLSLSTSKVLFEQQAHGVEKLTELGVNIEHEAYPMGHQSHPKETEAMAAFIERVLFPSE